MAIQWFAGEDKFDIGPHYEVHKNEVMESFWGVYNAVNMSESKALWMQLPSDHAKQFVIAEGFRAKLCGLDGQSFCQRFERCQSGRYTKVSKWALQNSTVEGSTSTE